MKQKLFFLALTLLFLGVTSMNAQVQIGGSAGPNAAAILDLNPDEGDASLGLTLPRVSLVDRSLSNPLPAHVRGMMVYNQTVSQGADLVEGVYFNNGEQWFPLQTDGSAGVSLPVIFLRNPGFAWLGADGNYQDTLFIELASKDPSMIYQWYQKNEDGSSTIVAGADSDTLFVKKGQYGIENEGQVYQFYCLVTSGSQYGISGTGRTVYGVGARLANGQWLKFKSFNLGATPAGQAMSVAEQIAYQPIAANAGAANDPAYDPTVYGSWYQWGRATDGHEDRTTPAANTYNGLLNATDGLETTYLDDANGQVLSSYADAYSKFIQRNAGTFDWRLYPETDENSATSPANDWTWGDPTNGITPNDPCYDAFGSPWRVPTQAEWAQVQSQNYWQWTVGSGGVSGYAVQPGGSATAPKPASLFLPAAGSRNRNGGAQNDVGSNGTYWSSTITGTNSYRLYFNSGSINAANTIGRSTGFTVRCVAE
jgi:uncharacterized protein (TIGR02145 family)